MARVVDECDVVDFDEGYAGSHLTPGTERLVLGSCFSTIRGGGDVYSFVALLAKQGDDRCALRRGAERLKGSLGLSGKWWQTSICTVPT
jgi:hypothetical protein